VTTQAWILPGAFLVGLLALGWPLARKVEAAGIALARRARAGKHEPLGTVQVCAGTLAAAGLAPCPYHTRI
jgi:hypothetical protein